MSRNKFRDIKKNLHLCDNAKLDKNDKFYKVRPLFNIINKRNLRFGIFSHNLSIDEEMVPYFGRHSAKMFIRGKPVRFGYKLWCLCSSDGYMYNFFPYGGARVDKSEMGLGADVVMQLLSVLENPAQHRIFFDNFFSSYKVFTVLHEKGIFATGTIRENRIEKCPLESSKSLGKKERGTYDFAFDSKCEVSVVRWNDNSVVTVISNNCPVTPLSHAKRYSRKDKKEVNVPQPKVIQEYNQYMGGVDLHDNGIANYRIRVRGKKWWWPLFINTIDSVIVNAWRIYRMVNNSKMSQLDFRSYIAVALIKSEDTKHCQLTEGDKEVNVKGTSKVSLGRPTKNSLLDEVRKDNVGHIITKSSEKARRRCRQCHNHTIFICKKCNVHLHTDCFKIFHSK